MIKRILLFILIGLILGVFIGYIRKVPRKSVAIYHYNETYRDMVLSQYTYTPTIEKDAKGTIASFREEEKSLQKEEKNQS